jgi:hypothetical protein
MPVALSILPLTVRFDSRHNRRHVLLYPRLELKQEISYARTGHSLYVLLRQPATINLVRGQTADVLNGLFERIKDDALPQGCGLSPRNTTSFSVRFHQITGLKKTKNL